MRLYRVALRAYPADYRRARGDEILATLEEVHGDARPSAGEVGALVLAGLAERDRADAAVAGSWWRGGLAALVLPLACVNAAIALTGLGVALDRGTGRWWPAFALVACALAAAAAARLPRALPALGLANLAFVLADAVAMAGKGTAVPHIRLLEHAPHGGTLPATVPSNPTELVPFALVLAASALAAGSTRSHTPVPRAVAVLVCSCLLAAIALLLPDHRFAWLLPPASVAALAALAFGAVYRRGLAIGAALLLAAAPSVFWYLTRGFPFERWETYGLAPAHLTRDVVPGLVGVGVLALAALAAAGAGLGLAHRRAGR